jgi:hypothetical protein
MATYWLTFRIADEGDYGHRYDQLHQTVFELTGGGKWWVEPTSFYVFESTLNADQVAGRIKSCLDEDYDLALLGMPNFKTARAIGAVKDQDLFDLIPFAKRA